MKQVRWWSNIQQVRRSTLSVLLAVALTLSFFISAAAEDRTEGSVSEDTETVQGAPEGVSDEGELSEEAPPDESGPGSGSSEEEPGEESEDSGRDDLPGNLIVDEDGNVLPGFATDGEGDAEAISAPEEPSEYTGIWAADTAVEFGDTGFDLLDGVKARDSEGAYIDEIALEDDGGFDVYTAGDYSVVYTAEDPHTGEVYQGGRTVSVGAGAMMFLPMSTPVDGWTALLLTLASSETEIELTDGFTFQDTVVIDAGKDITIYSADPVNPVTLVSADGKRHFEVRNGGKLTVRDLTLEGGSDGGGIANNGTLVLEDGALLTGNSVSATGSSNYARGGAVYNTRDFELRGGTITGNATNHTDYYSRSLGGGVYNTGTFTMHSGSVSGNEAGMGAGVWSSGAFTLESGDLSGNTAVEGSGGGVYVDESGTFDMTGGNIAGNETERYGGGVYMATNTVFNMTGGKISGGNTAYQGGGVYVSGTAALASGEISGNSARYGGGIYVNSSTTTLTNSEISGNSATASGGGLYNRGTFNMNGGEISGNSAPSSDSFEGGGGVFTTGTFVLSDGKITGNNASRGGGVCVSSGSFALNGGEISGNNATNGGGVYSTYGYSSGSMLTITNGKISGNSALSGGGGMYVGSYTNLQMSGGEISGNNAVNGGGVYATISAPYAFAMSGGTISNNTASGNGGGVYNTDTVTMSGSAAISGNSTDGDGGGVFNYYNSLLEMSDSAAITDNNATNGGGVRNFNNDTLTMSDGAAVTDNGATGDGGGVYNTANSTVGLSGNASITGNTAGNSGGAIHTSDRSKVTVGGNAAVRSNTASQLYSIADTDKSTHDLYITTATTPFSEGMAYAWNNYDINYTSGNPVVTYTVTFDGNGSDGGTVPADVTGAYDEVVTLPTAHPTRTGYDFNGWRDKSGGDPTVYAPGGSYTIKGDVNLAAVWQANTHTVTYHRNGARGTAPEAKTYTSGTQVNVAGQGKMRYAGYEFLGWSENSSADTPDYRRGGTKLTVTGDVELYAVWRQLDYTVTYDANGADSGDTPEDSNTYNYRDKVTIEGRGNLRREGYRFLGWSEQDDAASAAYTANRTYWMPDRDLYLFAVWVPVENGYTITVEHWRYGYSETMADAVLHDSVDHPAKADSTFTAVPEQYTGYLFVESESRTTIDRVTENTTLKLYYRMYEAAVITVDGDTITTEVIDRRLPAGTTKLWGDLVDESRLYVVYEGITIEDGVEFTSPDFDAVNFRMLGEYPVTVEATWTSASGDPLTASGIMRIIVVDTTPPELSRQHETVSVTRSTSVPSDGYLMALAGAQAVDNYDVTIDMHIYFEVEEGGVIVQKTASDLNWNQAGQEYLMFITAEDSSGNRAAPVPVVVKITGESSGGGSGGGGGGTTVRDNHDGSYTLIGDDGIPLGNYVFDDGWTFIPEGETPLGQLPKTGSRQRANLLLTCGMLCILSALLVGRRRRIARR